MRNQIFRIHTRYSSSTVFVQYETSEVDIVMLRVVIFLFKRIFRAGAKCTRDKSESIAITIIFHMI